MESGKSEVKTGWVGDDAVSECLYRCAACGRAVEPRAALAAKYFTVRGRPPAKPESKGGPAAQAAPGRPATTPSAAGAKRVWEGSRNMAFWCGASEVKRPNFVSPYTVGVTVRDVMEYQRKKEAEAEMRARLWQLCKAAATLAGVVAALAYFWTVAPDAEQSPFRGAQPVQTALHGGGRIKMERAVKDGGDRAEMRK